MMMKESAEKKKKKESAESAVTCSYISRDDFFHLFLEKIYTYCQSFLKELQIIWKNENDTKKQF